MGPTIVRAEPNSAPARRAMVDNQIRTFDVTDQRVLAAFEAVPREVFLSDKLAGLAYSDAILSVDCEGARRVLIAPFVLARMLQGLNLQETDQILVVGCGTGYPALLAAELCASVVALESEEGFVESIRTHERAMGRGTVTAVLGALEAGWRSAAPYSAILLCGAVERGLETLLHQLGPGGRLVAIGTASHEATRRSGKVVRFDRIGGEFSSRVLFDATTPVLDAFRLEPAFTF